MEIKKTDNWFSSGLKVLDTVSLAQIIGVLESKDNGEREKLLKDLKKTFAKRIELFQKEEKHKEDEQKRYEELMEIYNAPFLNFPPSKKKYKWNGEKMSEPEIVANLSMVTSIIYHIFDLLLMYLEEENCVDKKIHMNSMKHFIKSNLDKIDRDLYYATKTENTF